MEQRVKEVRNFIVVLVMALVFGALGVYVMFEKDPQGSVVIGHVLVSDETLARSRYTMEWSYLEGSQLMTQELEMAQYQRVYQLLANDSGVDQGEGVFSQGVLSIYDEKRKLFQQIQFAQEGDRYRVGLRVGDGEAFMYAYHPDVFVTVQRLLRP